MFGWLALGCCAFICHKAADIEELPVPIAWGAVSVVLYIFCEAFTGVPFCGGLGAQLILLVAMMIWLGVSRSQMGRR